MPANGVPHMHSRPGTAGSTLTPPARHRTAPPHAVADQQGTPPPFANSHLSSSARRRGAGDTKTKPSTKSSTDIAPFHTDSTAQVFALARTAKPPLQEWSPDNLRSTQPQPPTVGTIEEPSGADAKALKQRLVKEREHARILEGHFDELLEYQRGETSKAQQAYNTLNRAVTLLVKQTSQRSESAEFESEWAKMAASALTPEISQTIDKMTVLKERSAGKGAEAEFKRALTEQTEQTAAAQESSRALCRAVALLTGQISDPSQAALYAQEWTQVCSGKHCNQVVQALQQASRLAQRKPSADDQRTQQRLGQADKLIRALRAQLASSEQIVENRRRAIKQWCQKESVLLQEVLELARLQQSELQRLVRKLGNKREQGSGSQGRVLDELHERLQGLSAASSGHRSDLAWLHQAEQEPSEQRSLQGELASCKGALEAEQSRVMQLQEALGTSQRAAAESLAKSSERTAELEAAREELRGAKQALKEAMQARDSWKAEARELHTQEAEGQQGTRAELERTQRALQEAGSMVHRSLTAQQRGGQLILEGRVMMIESEKSFLEEKVAGLHKELANLMSAHEEECAALRDELSRAGAAESATQQVQQELALTKQALEDITAAVHSNSGEELQQQLVRTQDQLSRSDARAVALQQQLDSASADRSSLQNTIKALEFKAAEHDQSLQNTIKALEFKVQECSGTPEQLESAKKELAESKHVQEGLEQELRDARLQLRQAEHTKEELLCAQHDTEQAQQLVTELQLKLQQVLSQSSAQEAQCSEAQSQQDRLRAQLTDLQSQSKQQQQQHQTELEAANKRCLELGAANQQLELDCDQLRAASERTSRAAAQEEQQSVVESRQAVEWLQARVLELERELRSANSQLDSSSRACTQLEGQHHEVRRLLSDAQAVSVQELNEYSSKLEALGSQCRSLDADNSTLKLANDKLQYKSEALAAENEALVECDRVRSQELIRLQSELRRSAVATEQAQLELKCCNRESAPVAEELQAERRRHAAQEAETAQKLQAACGKRAQLEVELSDSSSKLQELRRQLHEYEGLQRELNSNEARLEAAEQSRVSSEQALRDRLQDSEQRLQEMQLHRARADRQLSSCQHQVSLLKGQIQGLEQQQEHATHELAGAQAGAAELQRKLAQAHGQPEGERQALLEELNEARAKSALHEDQSIPEALEQLLEQSLGRLSATAGLEQENLSMTVKLRACQEQLEDASGARATLLEQLKAQREEVDAAHVTHARLFRLQQNLNEMAAENATLQLNYDVLRQELAFSTLTAGGVDQEMLDSDSGEMVLVPAAAGSLSPSDAYDFYAENCTLRSQLQQVKRQLAQAVQEFEMQCEVAHATSLAEGRESAAGLQDCQAEQAAL